MKNLEALVNSLLDEGEKFIIYHQRLNVLKLDESDSISGDDSIQIPSLLAPISEKEKYQIQVYTLMNKYISEDWLEKDYKLISGTFSRTPLENTQIQAIINQSDRQFPFQSFSPLSPSLHHLNNPKSVNKSPK